MVELIEESVVSPCCGCFFLDGMKPIRRARINSIWEVISEAVGTCCCEAAAERLLPLGLVPLNSKSLYSPVVSICALGGRRRSSINGWSCEVRGAAPVLLLITPLS